MSYHDDEYELEADYVEAMVAQNDPDAQLVQSFEAEFEDFIQETLWCSDGWRLLKDEHVKARLLHE